MEKRTSKWIKVRIVKKNKEAINNAGSKKTYSLMLTERLNKRTISKPNKKRSQRTNKETSVRMTFKRSLVQRVRAIWKAAKS